MWSVDCTSNITSDQVEVDLSDKPTEEAQEGESHHSVKEIDADISFFPIQK